jgi:DNA repair protein RadC
MMLQFVSEECPGNAYALKPVVIADNHIKITRPEDVVSYFDGFFNHKKQEYFCSLNLDGSGAILSARIITIGLLNHSLVHPRETFRDAIIDGASSIIVVHNHPSGTLEPSPQDISITRQLTESGDILGIRVLDHIIITKDNRSYSFKEHGLI